MQGDSWSLHCSGRSLAGTSLVLQRRVEDVGSRSRAPRLTRSHKGRLICEVLALCLGLSGRRVGVEFPAFNLGAYSQNTRDFQGRGQS